MDFRARMRRTMRGAQPERPCRAKLDRQPRFALRIAERAARSASRCAELDAAPCVRRQFAHGQEFARHRLTRTVADGKQAEANRQRRWPSRALRACRCARRDRNSGRILSDPTARLSRAMLVIAVLLLCPTAALGSIVGAVNHARAAYCGLSSTAHPPLTASRKLDEVARLLAQGTSLADAERVAGYLAVRSLWIQITGSTNETAVERMVAQRFCGPLAASRLRQLGAYRRGRHELWIVVGEPFSTPPQRDAAAVSRLVLELTNEARARGWTCGGRHFPPAPPLSLAPALTRAARAHARDMAAHEFFSHTGSDGSSPGERVTRAGYHWREVGENIESGATTAREAVAGWLASPHHCANIMTAAFRQLGVAFAVNRDSRDVIYWTEDLGTPR